MAANKKKEMNGLAFHQYIETESIKKSGFSVQEFIFQFLMIISVLYGTLFSAITTLDIPVRKAWIYFAIFFFGLLLYVPFYMKRYTKRMLTVIILFYIIGFIEYFDRIKNGLYILENLYIDNINHYYKINLGYYVAEKVNRYYLLSVFFIAAIGIYTLLLYVCIFWIKSSWVYLIVTIPFIGAILAVGLIPSAIPFLFYCIGSLGVLIVLSSSRKNNSKEPLPIGQHKLAVKTGTILMTLAALILIITTAVFPKKKYDEKIDFTKNKIQIQTTIVELSEKDILKDITNLNFTFLKSGIASGGVNGGKLGRNNEIIYNNETALEVVAPNVNKKIYLKGYVGSVYNRNSWEDIAGADKEQFTSLNKELVKNNFFIENQTSDFIRYLDNAIDRLFTSNDYKKDDSVVELIKQWDADISEPRYIQDDILIKNIAANRDYYYTPYYSSIPIDTRNGTIQLGRSGVNENIYPTFSPYREGSSTDYKDMEFWDFFNYEFIYFRTQMRSDGNRPRFVDPFLNLMVTGADPEFAEFLEQGKHYEDFVYEIYTKIPEGTSPKTLADFKDKIITSDRSVEGVINQVRKYIMQKARYSLSPGSLPEGEDFIDHFLFTTNKGYCTHFASAGTILLRSLGIPARYVEGYVITEGDFKEGERLTTVAMKNGRIQYDQIKMDIKDKNAHAWTEVYFENYGWVPIDFTPGYIGENINISNIVETSKKVDEVHQKAEEQAAAEQKETPTPPEEEKKPEPETPPEEKNNEKEAEQEPAKENTNTTKDNNSAEISEETLFRKTLIKYAFILLIIISLLLLLLFLRNSYQNRQLRLVLSSKSIRKRILFLFGRMKKSLTYYNLQGFDDNDYESYINEVEKNLTYIKPGQFKSVFDTILRARFGKSEIQKEEYLAMKDLYRKIKKDIYLNGSGGNKFKRFYYKYIKSY